MARLIVLRDGTEEIWEGAIAPGVKLRLGRSPNVEISIREVILSRLHSTLELEGRRLFIRDAQSTSGTYVNDAQIRGRTPVTHRDRVKVGHVNLTLKLTIEAFDPVDPEEDFLAAIELSPEDDDQRLVYADWLEEHGNKKRAEQLRLQCRLGKGEDERPILERLIALADVDDTWWRKIIARPKVDKCARETTEINFKFKCPKRWSTLTPTDDPDVRHCADCQREVHYCTSLNQVGWHATHKHCVAFDAGLRREKAIQAYVEQGDRLPSERSLRDADPEWDMIEMGEVGGT